MRLYRDWLQVEQVDDPHKGLIQIKGSDEHLVYAKVLAKGPGWTDHEKKAHYSTEGIEVGDNICFSRHFVVDTEGLGHWVKARHVLFAYD